ncbi:VOC family protein [Bradyrhizobium diazoefficiens]|uniref:VOC family protein n=1 Tax=Bradyrhizobium diazoefficiens TaxID=1355477 RepID=UPI001B8CBA48|nr:VOC family protein [Bradyrhizobium diazoefficiens]MBR0863508.1 VOC family protein [Bradyrhizobium diazoefficiens]MBR0888193.1 VOC family protein [Bradyrhizobium diazoefficiens]MBR0919834.1 VOC family protein [Bradyrhizobium diazoefficiens]
MSGQILSVAHTGVTVSDLERATAFFRDVLGAKVTEPLMADLPVFEKITGVKDARIKIVFADLPGGHRIELLEYMEPQAKQISNLRPCDPGHMHLSLNVEGIEDIVEQLRRGGFEPVGPVQEVVEHGGIKAIYTVGFDNIFVELMYFPPGVA